MHRQATESITKVAESLSQQQIEQHYIPLLKRLSHAEWFTSRTSSAALYSPIYSKVSPNVKDEMRKGFAQLASDDTPMVRRAAAKWLGVRSLGICLGEVFSIVYISRSSKRWRRNTSWLKLFLFIVNSLPTIKTP
jgi:serine/threonine-protein phosphatase 2A regulatory subunit A